MLILQVHVILFLPEKRGLQPIGRHPSASITVQVAAFATGVPPNIYEFHLYTGNSAFLSRTQDYQYPMQFPG